MKSKKLWIFLVLFFIILILFWSPWINEATIKNIITSRLKGETIEIVKLRRDLFGFDVIVSYFRDGCVNQEFSKQIIEKKI